MSLVVGGREKNPLRDYQFGGSLHSSLSFVDPSTTLSEVDGATFFFDAPHHTLFWTTASPTTTRHSFFLDDVPLSFFWNAATDAVSLLSFDDAKVLPLLHRDSLPLCRLDPSDPWNPLITSHFPLFDGKICVIFLIRWAEPTGGGEAECHPGDSS